MARQTEYGPARKGSRYVRSGISETGHPLTSMTVSSRNSISLANSSNVKRKLQSASPGNYSQVDQEHSLIWPINDLPDSWQVLVFAVVPLVLVYALFPPWPGVETLNCRAGCVGEGSERSRQALTSCGKVDIQVACACQDLDRLECFIAACLTSALPKADSH